MLKLSIKFGGESEIRTRETRKGLSAFQADGIVHSPISPKLRQESNLWFGEMTGSGVPLVHLRTTSTYI